MQADAPLEVSPIDDSAVVREVIPRLLARTPEMRIEVAADAILAFDKMARRWPE